jgi:hypothetical protein
MGTDKRFARLIAGKMAVNVQLKIKAISKCAVLLIISSGEIFRIGI